jgi:rhodanese-related sulfurtransferase/ABC-type phosphate/phosphonate transport system substrate-binding protein
MKPILFVQIASTLTIAMCALVASAATDGAQPSTGVQYLRVVIAVEPVTPASNRFLKAQSLEAGMTKALGQPVKVSSQHSLRNAAIDTRSGNYDALWVTSNLAVSAIKDPRYEMIGFDGQMTRFALLAAPEIADLKALKGGILYLPQEDSAAGAAALGLLSDHGIRLTDFHSVFTSGNYEVAQLAIEQRIASVTSLPEPVVQAWLKLHPRGGRVLEVSAPVPGQTLVVLKTLSGATKQRLSDWFAQQAKVSALTAVTPAAFKYVTGLSHYTPEEVAGLQKVTASQVMSLVKAGAQLVDVRTAAEFATKHIAAATLLSYAEYSPRYVGVDISRDGFDVSKLQSSKRLVLYCNGPECWKSYKAAMRAIASKQFAQVYWFRGGLPEWERHGLATVRQE